MPSQLQGCPWDAVPLSTARAREGPGRPGRDGCSPASPLWREGARTPGLPPRVPWSSVGCFPTVQQPSGCGEPRHPRRGEGGGRGLAWLPLPPGLPHQGAALQGLGRWEGTTLFGKQKALPCPTADPPQAPPPSRPQPLGVSTPGVCPWMGRAPAGLRPGLLPGCGTTTWRLWRGSGGTCCADRSPASSPSWGSSPTAASAPRWCVCCRQGPGSRLGVWAPS